MSEKVFCCCYIVLFPTDCDVWQCLKRPPWSETKNNNSVLRTDPGITSGSANRDDSFYRINPVLLSLFKTNYSQQVWRMQNLNGINPIFVPTF